MNTNYKVLEDFPDYKIYSNGNIFNKFDHLMKFHLTNKGYYQVMIQNKGHIQQQFLVHRLIALAFIKNPNNYPEVNHLDGNYLNNDVNNLEWCNHQQNCQHTIDIGLMGIKKKLTIDDVKQIKIMLMAVPKINETEIGKKFKNKKPLEFLDEIEV
jgi:hypothetical protein